jgi:glycosyltransferase involved in cell wall biosynthesis
MPKVSVMTPVYNGARYIEEALDSLLAQTLQDWESVVIDDGSTDDTPSILRKYTDPRIKVHRQANGGEAAARNAALDRAAGEYLAFLDADDLYNPNALAAMTGYLDANPQVGAVFSDGIICDEKKQPLLRITEQRPGIYTGEILEALVLDPSVVSVPICTMVRLATVKENGIRFDRDLVIGPDYDFWIQVARFTKFGYLDEVTCQYRVHQTNITRTSGMKKRKADLARGKLKVMNSDWFGTLSVSTRYGFFYQLLASLMSGETEKQRDVLQSRPFLALPAAERANLHRYVGIDALLKAGAAGFAREQLEQALRLNGNDRKSASTLRLLNLSRPACILVLKLWKIVHRWQVWLGTLGQPKPKPVPAALGPITD